MPLYQYSSARARAGRFFGFRTSLLLTVACFLLSAARIARSEETEVPQPGTQSPCECGAAPADPPAVSRPAEGEQEAQPGQPGRENAISVNRITGTGAVSGSAYVPLTGRERWQLYLTQNFTSVGAWFAPVTSSLIDHVNSRPPEWGGDFGGYGRRLASRYGTNLVQGSVEAAGCAILGHDPRYIRSSQSGVWRRMGHAFLYSFLTRNGNGDTRLGIATLGSFYATGMVTQSWMPDRYRALGDGVREGNRQLIFSVAFNQFQEFWPEIRRLVRRK